MKPAQIVLIEDNPGDVLLFKIALKETEIAHQLTWFESGEDAIRVLCGDNNNDVFVPDAIFVDLNTPRADGFEVLHRFKKVSHFAGVPLAIVTSSQDPKDKNRTAIEGARYIEKSSQLDELMSSYAQTIREMLNFTSKDQSV